MPQHDSHHAALTAKLILDKAVSLHTGCQQLHVLLQRLGVDHFPAITAVGSNADFKQPPFRRAGSKEERAKTAEEYSAYTRIQEDVFAECRMLIQKLGAPNLHLN